MARITYCTTPMSFANSQPWAAPKARWRPTLDSRGLSSHQDPWRSEEWSPLSYFRSGRQYWEHRIVYFHNNLAK
eukprot:6489190-Amphidinium_carterae.1